MNSKKRRKLTLISLIVTSTLLVVMVLVTAYFIVRSGGKTWDSVLRDISAFVSNKSEASRIRYDYEKNSAYLSLEGNNTAVITSEEIAVYDKYGDKIFTEPGDFEVPAAKVVDKYALAYAIGGKSVRLFNADQILRSIEMENPVVDAAMNKKGWITVCTEDKSYKGLVTVYNAEGIAAYQWYSAEGYPAASEISEDGQLVTVLTYTASGSNIIKLRTNSDEVYSRYTISNEIVMDIALQSDGTVTCITDKRIIFVNPEGEQIAAYEFGDRKLASYAFESDGGVVLLCDDYSEGSQHAICVLSRYGDEKQVLRTPESVSDIAICKDFVAVMYSGEIVVYNKDLVERETYQSGKDSKELLLRQDGAAIAVFESSIRVYR